MRIKPFVNFVLVVDVHLLESKSLFPLLSTATRFNPLSPKIHIQIVQTDLHTFLLRIVERIWFKIKAFSHW